MIAAIGSRGVRTRSAPVRPATGAPEPSPVPVEPRRAPSAPPAGPWIPPLIGLAVGWLIGGLLLGVVRHGGEDGSGRLMDLVLVGLVLVLMIVRRRQAALAQPMPAAEGAARVLAVPPVAVTKMGDPSPGADLERGVRDIRRTDPGFDALRFTGYTAMMFRDAQTAWMTRDIASLRPRVTPEIYGELEAQCDRLRSLRRSNRVDEIEIRTEITEAWQEGGRDYVTAYITGSMVDYTVDDATDGPVAGSRTNPRDVEEFWTFTRPAGLNFWMLSAIQTS
jgi:predicted lipid-binding transport protein (Tim44 family)